MAEGLLQEKELLKFVITLVNTASRRYIYMVLDAGVIFT